MTPTLKAEFHRVADLYERDELKVKGIWQALHSIVYGAIANGEDVARAWATFRIVGDAVGTRSLGDVLPGLLRSRYDTPEKMAAFLRSVAGGAA